MSAMRESSSFPLLALVSSHFSFLRFCLQFSDNGPPTDPKELEVGSCLCVTPSASAVSPPLPLSLPPPWALLDLEANSRLEKLPCLSLGRVLCGLVTLCDVRRGSPPSALRLDTVIFQQTNPTLCKPSHATHPEGSQLSRDYE